METTPVETGILCIVGTDHVQHHLFTNVTPLAKFVDPRDAIFNYPKHFQALIENVHTVIFEWKKKYLSSFVTLERNRDPANTILLAVCDREDSAHVSAFHFGVDEVLSLPLSRLLFAEKHKAITRSRRQALYTSESAFQPSLFDSGSPIIQQDRGLISYTETIELDTRAHKLVVIKNSQRLEAGLTPKEYAFLELVMGDAGECFSRDELLRHVWGVNYDTETNILSSMLSCLRKKLSLLGLPSAIDTIRGAGYSFNKHSAQIFIT